MSQDPSPKPVVPTAPKVSGGLTAVNIAFGVVGALACPFALVSPMMFDKPGPESDSVRLLVVLTILTFPLTCLLSVVLSRVWWKRGAYRAAWVAAGLPAIWLAIIVTQLFLLGK